MKHRFAETTPHPALSPYPRGEDEGEGLRPFLRL